MSVLLSNEVSAALFSNRALPFCCYNQAMASPLRRSFSVSASTKSYGLAGPLCQAAHAAPQQSSADTGPRRGFGLAASQQRFANATLRQGFGLAGTQQRPRARVRTMHSQL